MSSPSLRDRFRGALVGGALGDALGAEVEFEAYEAIVARHGERGPSELPAGGRITDDTQMTLWTAEGLLRAKHRWATKGIVHLPSVVQRAYLRWLATQGEPLADDAALREAGWLWTHRALHARRAPGTTCLTALRTGRVAGFDVPLNDSKGCGGVMRVGPVGLLFSGEKAFDVGCQVAALTHGHPTGWLAAGAFAEAVASVCRGASVGAALDGAEARARGHRHGAETAGALASARRLAASATPDSRAAQALAVVAPPGGPGWVAEEALAVGALFARRYPDAPERALRAAVTHSGDSDSTASICGTLVGGALGEAALPARWLGALELAEVVRQVADDLHDAAGGGRGWYDRYPPV